MLRDLKEIVGVLMRVLDGDEVSRAELAGLSFAAHREVRTALLEAYIKLLEFARYRDLRSRDAAADYAMRTELAACLDRIVGACDRERPPVPQTVQTVSIH
ncbi:MAG: hypothetical protein WCE79_01625 [Xanthobacteraceae bacterium]